MSFYAKILFMLNLFTWLANILFQIKVSFLKQNIKKFITKVANKNIQKISGWYKAHPETDVHDSAAYNLHLNIMKQSMGGSSLEQMERNNDKIVKNIAKHVMIDKSCKGLEPFIL